MESYTNCRQFNCVTPIVEQSEYHMFCREKCELYLPEMFNKIGVGLMAWGPLSMALGEAQNGTERLLFPKQSFKTKASHSYSWTEDEVNKNVSIRMMVVRNACVLIHIILAGIWLDQREGHRNQEAERSTQGSYFASRQTWLQPDTAVDCLVFEARASAVFAVGRHHHRTTASEPSGTSGSITNIALSWFFIVEPIVCLRYILIGFLYSPCSRSAAAASLHRRHARAGTYPREQADTTASHLDTGPSVTISLPPGTA